jgi:hypothetical protein
MVENQNNLTIFSEAYSIKFEENLSNSIGTDIRSQTDRQTDMTST